MGFLQSVRRPSRSRAKHLFFPQVQGLENRLPPGDMALAGLLTSWWRLALPALDSPSFTPPAFPASSAAHEWSDSARPHVFPPGSESRPHDSRASFWSLASTRANYEGPPPAAARDAGLQLAHLAGALAPQEKADVHTHEGEHSHGEDAGPGGTGSFHGHGRFERIVWDPSRGYVELYEFKAFLTPVGEGTGYSYHMGDPGTALHPGTGCITLRNLQPGSYTLLTSWGEFFPRGKVVPGIVIEPNRMTEQNADEALDYSGYLTRGEWDPTGGNPVFQTFWALGTSITRASFAKADSNATGRVEFSLHEYNGGPVETWPQVGPTRSTPRRGYGADHWVAWNAGELATTPGQLYAIKLRPTNGVPLQPYWSNDDLYPYATGYRGSEANPADHDYYVAIFSDNDGTINTISVRSPGYTNFAGWRERWAQSYTARGTAFAGASLMGTVGGASGWQFSVRVRVHAGSPDGPQVGPTKTMPAAYAPFAGVAGAAFGPREVPTVPGQTYWVVYENVSGAGFNAYRMNEGDSYAAGTAASFDGGWQTQPFDLFLNLYEYAGQDPAENLLDNSSFEESSGGEHPGWGNNAGFGTNGQFPNPGQAWTGRQWASYSYGGGNWVFQELYQTVTVTPGRAYQLSARAFVGGTHGLAAASLLWADGEYPGRGLGDWLDYHIWSHPEPATGWRELSGFVIPSSDSLTFILRADVEGYGGGINLDAAWLAEWP